MKLNYFSICLSLISLSLGFVACKPEEEITPIEPLQLDLKVTDLTPSSAQITITPNHTNSKYFWNIRTSSDYESMENDQRVIETDVATLHAKAEAAGKEYDEYLNSILISGTTTIKIDTLTPETSYYAYAFEIGPNGFQSNSIETTHFTTPKTPIRVNLNITPGMTFFEVEAITDGDDFCYYFDAMPEYLYDQYGGTDEGAAEYFRESLEYTAENRGWSIEKVIEAIGRYGNSYSKIERLELDTPYYIYVVEIDNHGNVLNVATTHTSTLERQMSDLTIDINTVSLNSFKTEIEFVPSNDNEAYYFQMLTIEEYNEIIETHGDCRDYYINKFGADAIQNASEIGTHVAYAKNLSPETDYIIFAFGFKDYTWNTEIFTKQITTPAPSPANELTLDIDILETTNHYCTVSIKPSDETIPYMFYYMTEEQYKTFGNDTISSVQESVTQYLAAYQKLYPEMSIEQLVKGLSKRANRNETFKYLAPSTKHYVWAVSVDENGQIVSQPAIQEFTTGEYIVAENCIVKEASYKYWDGDEMADYASWPYYRGFAVIMAESVTVENSNTWLGCFYKGDLTDEEEYPDYYIASNLFFTGKRDIGKPSGSMSYYPFEWQTITLCISAQDENGNFGPVFRKKIDLTKEGRSPIEEFPYYDSDNNSPTTPEHITPLTLGNNNCSIIPSTNSHPESAIIRSSCHNIGPLFKIEKSTKETVRNSDSKTLILISLTSSDR